jgi:penicillin-binding protein 2
MSGFERIPLNIQRRVYTALALMLFFFLIIILKLWYLQIMKGEYFRFRSENNRLVTVFIPPSRGLIFDRNGELLAGNRPSFNIELISESAPTPVATLEKLAEILDYDPEVLKSRLSGQSRRRRFEPKLILKDVSREEVAKVAARRYELPGIVINAAPTREYLFGEFAAHVVGYIREITRSQLDKPSFSGYRQGDMVGQYGIESVFEGFLQGTRGRQRVVVNAMQTRVALLSNDSEIPGHNITLTIDKQVQLAADTALRDKKGAVVALDVKTGEVLAMASSPGFDPNIFTRELPTSIWNELISGAGKKLNNRSLQGAYPPGSTYKIFMALAALQEGVISASERVNCPGFLRFAGRNYRCHRASGHGAVDLKSAMIQSCNVYFYTLGQRLGIDRIYDYSTRFGLGVLTGLDLMHENRGLIPSSDWKRRTHSNPQDQRWYPGETLSVAIGQGAVDITPMQMARAMAALANGGELLRPYLVKKISSHDGLLQDDNFHRQVVANVNIDQRNLHIVKDSLKGVVHEPGGTGRRARLSNELFEQLKNEADLEVYVAGKTGTAQAVRLGVSDGRDQTNEALRHHAWFVGYAPADSPEIAVSVVIENAGVGGGVAAAPVVSQVLEAYFSKRVKRLEADHVH